MRRVPALATPTTGQGPVVGVEHALGNFQEVASGLRENDQLLVSHKEKNVIFLLELSNLVGDRRLRQEQGLG